MPFTILARVLCLTFVLALGGALATPVWAAPPGPAKQHRWQSKARPAVSGRDHFRVATFNVQNLFRYRKDVKASYFPDSPAAYRKKVKGLAQSIVREMKSPEVIALQEIENMAGSFAKSAGTGAQPKVIKDLIKAIDVESSGKLQYAGAGTPTESDTRGISQWFLYDKSRVSLAQPIEGDPALGTSAHGRRNDLGGPGALNPSSFNKPAHRRILSDGYGGRQLFGRPVLAARFVVHRDGVGSTGPTEEITVVNTHMKSQPHRFALRRRGQARVCANLVRDIAAPRGAKVVFCGDLNLDLTNPAHRAQAKPLLQLTQKGGKRRPLLKLLNDRLGKDAYSFVYRNKGEGLDWMMASPSLERRTSRVFIPHVNAGQPGAHSDHDPVVADFKLW